MLKKILSSSFFILLGNSIARGIMFLFNIIVARMIDVESYGQYAIIKSTMTTVANITNSSVNISIIKLVAEKRKEKSLNLIYSIFLINFIISISSIVFIYLTKDYLINNLLLNNKELYLAFDIALVYLLFSLIGTMIQSTMIGFEKFKDIAISNLYTSIIFFPIACGLVYQFKFLGTIYSLILFFILFSFFQYVKLRQEFSNYSRKIDFKKIITLIKNTLKLSFPLLLSSVIALILFWYARILLVNESNNFKEVAIFDAAYQLISIIMIITGATTSVVLPMLSNSKVDNNKQEMFHILKITFSINVVFSFFVSIIIMFFASSIMSLYGKDFVSGAKVLEIIIFVSVFFSASSILNKYMIAKNLVYQVLMIIIISAIIFYIAMIYSIPSYGAIGLAYSMILYYFILTFFYGIYILTRENK